MYSYQDTATTSCIRLEALLEKDAFPPGKEGYKGLPCLGKLNTSADHKTKQTPAWLSLLTELVILRNPCSLRLQRTFAAMPCSCWQEAWTKKLSNLSFLLTCSELLALSLSSPYQYLPNAQNCHKHSSPCSAQTHELLKITNTVPSTTYSTIYNISLLIHYFKCHDKPHGIK